MPNVSGEKRTDTASRFIKASPHTIYQALVDPEAVASWRPPKGMTAQMHVFDPHVDGQFRMSLTYTDADHAVRGKTSGNVDVVRGRFLELVSDRRVVELVEFESDDPAFAGEMTITTTLAAAADGTEVTILCENVPSGIRASDHQAGMMSSLENLAAFVE